MPRERVYQTRAVILKRRDQGEADRLLTVYTPEMGKRVFLARGVRKPASRKAGHLEPFTHVSLLVAQSQSWDLVTQVETVYGFRALREDLDRTAHAYYVVELIDAFTQEEDSHPELFDLLLTGLRHLEESSKLALSTRWFEMALLRITGYQPQLHVCVECGEPLEPVTNYLSMEQGGMLCPRHGEGRREAEAMAVGTLKVLRYLQTQPYGAVMALDLSPQRLQLVERTLASYIRVVIERKLKSPAFIHLLQD